MPVHYCQVLVRGTCCAQGVLLRRTKGSLINGRPIVELPAREVCHARLEFPPAERANYEQLQQRSMAELKVPAACPQELTIFFVVQHHAGRVM